jgi:transcriptional regulator GlxA family with amidase domain
MKRRRIYLMITGMAAAAGLVAAAASAGSWRTPENVVSARMSGYENRQPVLRPLPDGQGKPVVVVLADNAGTETTDFIVPYAMLKHSGVAEVRAVATENDAVELMPALRIRADETIEEFRRRQPDGADVVVVPAMHNQENPEILTFLRSQASAGALIVSICDGAWVVANAGLFDGRQATGHWFSFNSLARKFPETSWVRDSRIVADGNVMSTTGVSASIPVSLALIELLADRTAAERVAARFGISNWSYDHDSEAFGLSSGMLATGLGNLGAFWRHEELAVEVGQGFDEIGLALQADAWSRTFRSTLSAFNEAGEVVSSNGLTFITEVERLDSIELPIVGSTGKRALDETLAAIERRHGAGTSDFVAVQLEYERAAAKAADLRRR